MIITDIGILQPDADTRELTLTHLHPGATVEQARLATGWELSVGTDLQTTAPPTQEELRVLRRLEASKSGA